MCAVSYVSVALYLNPIELTYYLLILWKICNLLVIAKGVILKEEIVVFYLTVYLSDAGTY